MYNGEVIILYLLSDVYIGRFLLITCNGDSGLQNRVIGLKKRLPALRRLPKEDAALIKAYSEQQPGVLHYPSVCVFHCFSEDTAKTYFIVGLDDKPARYTAYEDFRLAEKIMAAAMQEGVSELAVEADTLDMEIGTLIDGLLYRNYEFLHYQKQAENHLVTNINVLTHHLRPKEFNSLCYMYTSIYEGVNLARDLVNMPPNELTPRKFADIAGAVIKGDNIRIESLNKWAIEKHNMGGIAAVGRGSMNPPQLLTIAYQGDPKSKEVLGIVGKGVTYDSGGLSLKSQKNLEFMKDDMAGAAAAVGVIRALMLLKYPVNVLAVVPLVENLPSGMAYHVDDILTMYDGQTVEIKSTDAEGRLILADALTYAQEKGATQLIDLATLTGACVSALGSVRSGMLGNNQEWMNHFFRAATDVHEKVWQLPADAEYENLLHSDVADLKNTGGPGAGAITAGLFLKHFVQETTPWIHLDIAGTAFQEKPDSTGFIGATGVGIKSILRILQGGEA